MASHQAALHRFQVIGRDFLSFGVPFVASVPPVFMELNDTQTIQQGDHRSFMILWELNSGSRPFLAE